MSHSASSKIEHDSRALPTSERTIDLTECEREPICHLGLIQPEGYLLALNSDAEITHVSDNIGTIIRKAPRDALGGSLQHAFGPESGRLLQNVAATLRPGQTHHQPWDEGKERYSLWAHRRGSQYILEWEPLPESETGSKNLIGEFMSGGLSSIIGATHLQRQAQVAADLAAQLTGFDRVMVYLFHPDWSGEVIAEFRHPRAEPYLGLRYPASDIPPQARRLYLENLLRIIADVGATPVGILSLPGQTAPLDLTMCQLRAVSPYHIEYLRNMKVGATATASLICSGNLWGLLACHHDRRKPVDPPRRMALSEIARTLSTVIEDGARHARRLSEKRVTARRKKLEAAMAKPAVALTTILFGRERLSVILPGCGTAVWTSGALFRTGLTPEPHEIERYASQVLAGSEDVAATDSRESSTAQFGFAPSVASLAGFMAIVVSRQPALVLFAFRAEAIREITWGGDINQPVLRDERTQRLSPRRSFAHYKQSIAGEASPWVTEDFDTARIVREALRARASTEAQGPPDAAPEIGGSLPSSRDPAAITCASSFTDRMSRLIDDGFAEMRSLMNDDCPLQYCFLDAVTDGICLLFRSDSRNPAVRYASQTLLDAAESPSQGETDLSSADRLLEAVGLPSDLLESTDLTPRHVKMPLAREGLRDFLVHRRLAFEISDRQGTASLSALLFNDITRSERAREAHQAAQARAEHLAFLKSTFLANMSHEIRTPLNGVLGMVQLLQLTRTDPEQRSYLEVMQRSGEVLIKVINDILDHSKIEAGHMELENAPFDLTAVVEDVVDMLRPKAHAKGIGLTSVFESPAPRWYEGDGSRLTQVILNIAGNAVKFTSAGSVVVRLRCSDPDEQPGFVIFSVTDTGIGIAPEHMEIVFEKFRQADQSNTRKYGGTGLGLAIARELVALMGGAITLSSKAGEGSTFTVSLPLKRSRDPRCAEGGEAGLTTARTTGASPRAAPGTGRRILVAEDNRMNQLVIQAMLKQQGFEVDLVESGLRALDLLQHHCVDLIFMDCQMPDLDGYQTTGCIRTIEGSARHTPIVALTAAAMPEDRQRCLDAGMDDYLPKPIQMTDLFNVLRRWHCLSPGSGNPSPAAARQSEPVC